MSEFPDRMIGQLVADLKPVRPLRQGPGMTRIVAAFVAGIALVKFVFGLRPDLVAGQPDPMFLTASGLFLILAAASAWAAVDMARPSVGTRRDSWIWTAAMAAVLPAGALGQLAMQWLRGGPVAVDAGGIECLTVGCITGMITLTTLVLWLRRGAPSSPRRAGLLIGVAAGAAGIFAVSLCCPRNDLIHIGMWHGGTVMLMGLLGRLTLPRLLAW
ncbi:MAG: NrsF family protein [Novosphingobium sp.]